MDTHIPRIQYILASRLCGFLFPLPCSSHARPQITYIFIIKGTLNRDGREVPPGVGEAGRDEEEWGEETSPINLPVINVVRRRRGQVLGSGLNNRTDESATR